MKITLVMDNYLYVNIIKKIDKKSKKGEKI